MQILDKKLEKPTTSLPTEAFLEFDSVSKVYPTKDKGTYTVLEDVNLTVQKSEFVSIIGHSGCGKSTLLSMVSGLNKPTSGEIRLKNQRITQPGPDRMVIFQNYSLLPWKTAYENVYLAVNQVFKHKSNQDKKQIVLEYLELVGLAEAIHKKPAQLSGGMKQRVAIARALATSPEVLIMDEPFGALDPITREEMQEELLKIWRNHRATVLMITHDIDEALFLSDKLVMMTNGPSANIGEVIDLPFSRPRHRMALMENPQYYELRNYVLDFLYRRFAHDDAM
ncbi:nitrate ABC transporter, ATPase subunits C and D [Rippkaea orientalis PCC 8801]|uniref:Nitrate ABC transporter, ATPase subunits C and D n=1 Tax=Rippkaea orientalis (strain PCC 8801 / RF-1) TaxID=41431 RepID=B7JVI2_RIPO1|nr:nitrate ABC transporter ATP-binding protein [Rippkaea orientalis]ACK68315.1 nitrate ABC transporter, ATPase subunits C and D [Rippkaea orientalis PCC 8801]